MKKKNTIIGITLVLAALATACVLVSPGSGVVDGLVGKAVWYLPYATLVGGVQRLLRTRG